MLDSDCVAKICRRAGYPSASVSIENAVPAYKGSPENPRRKVVVIHEGTKTIAVPDYRKRLSDIRQVQNQIPEAAQILEILQGQGDQDVALIEKLDGTLLWELETNRPQLGMVTEALDTLVLNLQHAHLVHADIRPWNIIYQDRDSSFRCIDWGFAFFLGDTKYGKTGAHLSARGHQKTVEKEIDRIDADRTITVLKCPHCLESLWNHAPDQFKWRPKPWGNVF